MPRQDQRAHNHEEHTAHHLHRVQMTAKARVESQEALDAERRQQKWHSQSRRIYDKQEDAFYDRVLRTGDDQHSGEIRADTGRPAKSEGEADNECAYSAALALHLV